MKARKKAYRSRAVAGVWVATMLFLIVAMLGWAMDTSYVVYVGQQLQVAADAGSLAGALLAKTDIPLGRLRAQATSAANTAGITAGVPDPVLLNLNEANLPEGDIVTGRFYRWYDPITEHDAGDFVPTEVLGEVNSVKAVARRTDTSLNGRLPLLFGPIFGVAATDLTRDAVAMVGGATGAGLIVLCPDCECALDFSGTTQLTLANDPDSGYTGEAIIQVDSNATGCSPRRGAMCANGNTVDITAPAVNLVAEGPEAYCLDGLEETDVPPINRGMPYIPDPLAALPEPDYNLMPVRGCVASNNACTTTQACFGGLSEIQGLLCTTDADCTDDVGTCDPAPSTCGGGPNVDVECAVDADCEVLPVTCDLGTSTCTDGPDAGTACLVDTDCGNWTCDGNGTICYGGPYAGATCSNGNQCTEIGRCNPSRMACSGGVEEELRCTSNDECLGGGECRVAPFICYQGDNHNGTCTDDTNCPGGGECLETEHVRPGYYPGGIRINVTNFRVILEPGIYSLDDVDGGSAAGLFFNGGHLDASSGVLLHIVGNGVVDLGGGATVIINPISDPADIYYGISIFQSRTNYNDARIIGNDEVYLNGTYYFPRNKLEVGGTGIALGNQLITWTMDMHGEGTYSILYDGRAPAPGYRVWLVE